MPTLVKPKKKSTYKKHTDCSKAYDYRWHKLRDAFLMEHPLCQYCLDANKTTAAEEVHHIIPLSTAKDEWEMKDLLYDTNNLVSLCKDCHHEVHNKVRKKKKNI